MHAPSPADLPAPSGLYDPRFEHDACGVSFVVDIKGRRAAATSSTKGIGALCNLEHRGATGAEADTGDGAGILIQVPDRFLRAVAGFELPAAGAYAAGIAFLPADAERRREGAGARSRRSSPTRASPSLGWRDVPDRRLDCSGATRPRRDAELPAAVRQRPAGAAGHRPGPQGLRRPQAHRARAAAPSSATLLPVAVQPHPRLQGHAHHAAARPSSSPTCPTSGSRARSRWCTAGSPPTPSRAGRWPTRTATSPTTARSTPSGQPQLDARPRGAARQRPAARASSGSSRSAPRASATPPASTRCSNCCTSAAAACRTPMLMMIPEAWENHDDDGRREAGVLPVPRLADGAVGRPGVVRVHRRHRHRRRARPQRPAPQPLLGHRRRPGGHGLRGRRARHRPGQGRRARAACSPAACSWSTPPRAASSTTRRSSATLAAEHPYGEWLDDGLVHLDDLPDRAHIVFRHDERAAPPADVRLHPRGAEAPRRARWRRPAPSRSARWAPTRRSPCSRAARGCCSTTSSSCSPR